ncbi:MAG: hypothetical protein AAF960_27570 [Bacteroidota bacterium]
MKPVVVQTQTTPSTSQIVPKEVGNIAANRRRQLFQRIDFLLANIEKKLDGLAAKKFIDG